MKRFLKYVSTIGLICFFCAACYDSRTFDSKPTELARAFDIYNERKGNLYKATFGDVDENIYKYKPDTVARSKEYSRVTDTSYGFINFRDHFVFCESQTTLVLTANTESVPPNSIKTYILLDDCCYGLFGSLHKKYIGLKPLSKFLHSYDYYYIVTSEQFSFHNYTSFPRDIYYKGDIIVIKEGVLVSPKSFCLLPMKDGLLKLDDLVAFHKNNYDIGYTYEQMIETTYTNEGTNIRKFTDFFWNDMDEGKMIESFKCLFENPPFLDLMG